MRTLPKEKDNTDFDFELLNLIGFHGYKSIPIYILQTNFIMEDFHNTVDQGCGAGAGLFLPEPEWHFSVRLRTRCT